MIRTGAYCSGQVSRTVRSTCSSRRDAIVQARGRRRRRSTHEGLRTQRILLGSLSSPSATLLLLGFQAEYDAALGFEVLNANADAVVSQQEFLKSYSSSRRGTTALDAIAAAPAAAAAAAAAEANAEAAAITTRQYALLALKSGLPFVAFGFVDNFIMVRYSNTSKSPVRQWIHIFTSACACGT